LAGSVERLGRLRRSNFNQVLRKHLHGLPIQAHNGTAPDLLERHLTEQMTSWLYCPNAAEQVVVELTYVGESNPVARRIADFLTPALVDRAVQSAAIQACKLHNSANGNAGISATLLAECIESQ